MKNIVVFLGPAGSGKTSLYKPRGSGFESRRLALYNLDGSSMSSLSPIPRGGLKSLLRVLLAYLRITSMLSRAFLWSGRAPA
ncbi:hypothetical protein, partial [Infirmifilum uzonense]|uniref:hypothetical protein n=1 Tax=Infirmifilum uzonense TaxID=1550241 RepID=UPI003C72B16B